MKEDIQKQTMKNAEIRKAVIAILKKHQEHGLRYAVDEITTAANDYYMGVIEKVSHLKEDEYNIIGETSRVMFIRGYNKGVDDAIQRAKELLKG